ncbi:5'-3' exonuclease H3TH domain-containing protein [Streptomyces sp. NPDC048281]|uniref:5'-3' exonuclease n=1 Tax=Streptomyces sp. NPDC048281 TaxID=3154715 RepID=UPI00342FEA95
MRPPTLLIDGNNILIRAVEATRRSAMHSSDGTDTSALVVFVKTISRYIRQYRPYRATVLWDATGTDDWRKMLYPAYKANRPTAPDAYRRDSRYLVREFLQLAAIPQHAVPGMEADDLIGAYWRRSHGEVVILSSDKDLLQLVGPTPRCGYCCQVRVSSADTPTDVWTSTQVERAYGCTPEQLPLVLALAGDQVDNIPGVPKIGPKFAVKHLAAAGWDLDKVAHQGIKDHREKIGLYLQLVNLRAPWETSSTDLPTIPLFRPTDPGPDAAWRTLWAFLDDLQLRQFQRQLLAGELW